MNQLVESLKRLYECRAISETVVLELLAKGTITHDEKAYIMSL